VVAAPRRPPELGADQLGRVDLDDDLALEVLAGVEVQVCVGGASEAVGLEQAWVQPRYGLIVQRNGIRDRFGTSFNADRARIS
jgi:hypothetical protein